MRVSLLVLIIAICFSSLIDARSLHQERRFRTTPYGPSMIGGRPSVAAGPTTIGSTSAAAPTVMPSPSPVATAPSPSPSPTVTAPAPTDDTFPRFANIGGSPDQQGVWYSNNYISMNTPSGFVSTVYLGNGQFMQQMGRFESWECIGKGKYRAVLTRRDTYSNGTIITSRRCEVGEVNLKKQQFGWSGSDQGCPPNDTPLSYLKRVNSKTQPGSTSYVCKVAGSPTNMNTSSAAGLSPSESLGVKQVGTLPPPFNGTADSQLKPGAPAETNGIWYSGAKKTAELMVDGQFSSVAQNPDNTFIQVLGNINSYKCTPTKGYKGAASYALSMQDSKMITGSGCTIGKVDSASDIYTWQPVKPKACAATTVAPKQQVSMRRVAQSDVIPSGIQSCPL